MSDLTRLRAEWYRHGLHDAHLRGEHAISADELRSLVASYERVLFTVAKHAEREEPSNGE